MKTFYAYCLLSISFLFATGTFAATRTVSNIPTTSVAQFSSVQAAVDASSSGDSIVINGSFNNYAGFTVNNKRLTIIGPGWRPDQLINQYQAKVGFVRLNGAGCNGSEIQGLVLLDNFVSNADAGNSKADSIRIIRNYFVDKAVVVNQPNTTYRNYRIEGNYFVQNQCCNEIHALGNNSSVFQDFIFRNNVFFASNGTCCSYIGAFDGFNNIGSSILLDHNIWYGPVTGQTRDAFVNNCSFLTFSNNIFIRRNVTVSNSTFVSNLTFQCSNNTPWSSNNNINSSGNISNTDPEMGAQSIINAGGGNSNNPLLDFTISTGPANNAGSDGKDLGLLFEPSGPLNWANSRNSRLPRVYEMTITNPLTPSGGTLNVNVTGKTSY